MHVHLSLLQNDQAAVSVNYFYRKKKKSKIATI